MTAPDAKAVEAAIEAYEGAAYLTQDLDVMRDAARAWLDAQNAEPVAWMYGFEGVNEPPNLFLVRHPNLSHKPWIETPLYTHPSPKEPT